MLCKYPDKPCIDNYYSAKGSKNGYTLRKYCRISEWKLKKGVCPFDKNIMSRASRFHPREKKKRLPEEQRRLW
jgi:hypothetical protein